MDKWRIVPRWNCKWDGMVQATALAMLLGDKDSTITFIGKDEDEAKRFKADVERELKALGSRLLAI